MKLEIKTILLLVLLVGIVVFLVGQFRWPIQLAQGWTPPVQIAESQEGESGGVNVYKWRRSMILLQQRYDWSAKSSKCSIMVGNNDFSNSWTQLPLSEVPGDYAFYIPAFDQTGNKIMFERGYLENDQLMMSIIFVQVTGNGEIQTEAEMKWTTGKKSLFENARPNILLNDPGRRDWPRLGFGFINGSDIYIPYCIIGEAWQGNGVNMSDSLFNNGVFHSTDSGRTWQTERVSSFEGGCPWVCKTKDYYYFFASKDYRQLLFSRKSVNGGSWDKSETMTTRYASGVYGLYMAAAEGDTVHICWLDRRHTRWRFNPEGPLIEDHEVAYCRRTDSDAHWNNDVIVSRGVRKAYAPAMSVEGDKIVIVWAGEESAGRGFSHNPNEIFYATSKDGGKTWARPLRITDAAKNGFTSNNPQVAVQNGVIHLFYVQGREDRHLSRQAPWPVYYQQRPFPN